MKHPKFSSTSKILPHFQQTPLNNSLRTICRFWGRILDVGRFFGCFYTYFFYFSLYLSIYKYVFFFVVVSKEKKKKRRIKALRYRRYSYRSREKKGHFLNFGKLGYQVSAYYIILPENISGQVISGIRVIFPITPHFRRSG